MTALTQFTPSGSDARGIAASFEGAIVEGALPPGARLPSVRSLATSLDVSPTTVAAAMRELRRRGLVVTRERSGAVVAGAPPLGAQRRPAPAPGLRDLAAGNPDPALLPDLGATLRGLDPPVRLYGSAPAVEALAERGRALLAADGIEAAHLTVASGALDGVERVLAAHLRPGDRVAVEDPGYGNVFDLLRAMGLAPVAVAVDDRGPVPDALARVAGGVSALVLTPRAQNPTGAALDARRAGELRAVLDRRPDLLVIEDDHAGAVAGAPALTVSGGRERWAVVRSFAKSLGPDLRVALVAGDTLTVARVEGRLAAGPGWVSGILQHLVAALLDDEAVAGALETAARTYAVRRAALHGALAAHGIAASGRSGFNVWIPARDEAAAIAALAAEGLAVAPGSAYRLASPPAIRITTSALAPEAAPGVAAAVARALRAGR